MQERIAISRMGRAERCDTVRNDAGPVPESDLTFQREKDSTPPGLTTGSVMNLVQFKTPRLRAEWESSLVDERLRNVLRILAMKFGGLRITCLLRTDEENAALPGASPRSLHRLDPVTGKCRAADFNPPSGTPDALAGAVWRESVRRYAEEHIRGVRCVTRDHGTAPHVHLEIRAEVVLLESALRDDNNARK